MPKLIKMVVPILLLMAILIPFTFYGCGGTYTPSTMPWAGIAPEDLTQQQWLDILLVSQEYYEHLNNYKLDTLTSVDTDAKGGANPWSRSLSTDVAGVRNVGEDQTELARSSSVKMEGLGQNGEVQEIIYDEYFLNDWAYVNMITTNLGTFWVRTKRSSDIEKTLCFYIVDQEMKPLSSPASIKYVKTEKVNNDDCYVLSITPNNNELANWLNEQDIGRQNLDWQKIVNGSNVFNNFTFNCYVAKDSYLISRIIISFDMELTPEQAGATATDFNTMQISLNMTMTLNDFNIPNDITLPTDALASKEVSGDVFSN